jgi:acetylglutamate synthase
LLLIFLALKNLTKLINMELTFNPNASPKAIEAAKKLIERYNSITIEEIEGCESTLYRSKAHELTGFGSDETCVLCRSVLRNCSSCIYFDTSVSKNYGCTSNANYETYIKIISAKNPKQLLTAFRNRAAHITKIVELIEKHQANETTNS